MTLPAPDKPLASLDPVQAVWALLPQTQCKRCGFEDCQAYAQAIVQEHTPINRCPPGGEEGVRRLAELTGQAPTPLDAQNGLEGVRQVAWVDENWCIGCTLCLDACPTDAIVGTHKSMHTVIEVFCTGCELCLPVCPVDCIELEVATPERTGWQAWSPEQAQTALSRYQQRRQRLINNTRTSAPRTHTQAKRLHLSSDERVIPGEERLIKPLKVDAQTDDVINNRAPPLATTLLAQALERAKRLRS